MIILVTGAAGFIGSRFIKSVLMNYKNIQIVGIDNFDPFYSKDQKELQNEQNKQNSSYHFVYGDIRNQELLNSFNYEFDSIIHFAAKAGVRPSIDDPIEYQDVNVNGTLRLLEFAKSKKIENFIFASSSSVYGINENVPWCEDFLLQPISPYAWTKLSCEHMGHVYSQLYGIRFLALRFFTVYGPGQRPDLAIHKFTKNIIENRPILIFGNGDTFRDYTYIDDIIDGIIAALFFKTSKFEVFNLGNNKVVSLKHLIICLERAIGKNAIMEFLPEQPGDVPRTFASLEKSKLLLGYSPKMDLDEGLKNFVKWYTENLI